MGRATADGGVPHGALCIAFAEAVLGDDAVQLAAVRQQFAAAMGMDALVDAAAVAALFNAIDRVADATGIPLEDEKAAVSKDFRAELGIDAFHSVQAR